MLVQLLYYATVHQPGEGNSQQFGGTGMVRGGFLFSLDICSSNTEILYCMLPVQFTNVESVHDWAKRMANITKSIVKNPHAGYAPSYTWDNSALQ